MRKSIIATINLALTSLCFSTLTHATAQTIVYQPSTIGAYFTSKITDQQHMSERDATAQATTPETGDEHTVNNEEILEKLEIKDSITPETTELLGESINLDTGGISFSNTDIALPGNFDLPVEIKRSFKNIPGHLGDDYALGDWELDIPMITTDLLKFNGTYSSAWGQGLACSGQTTDPYAGSGGKEFWPHEYWNGDMLAIPGKVNERLIHNLGVFTNEEQFPRITKSGWRVKCFSISASAGEGFEVHSPNGTVYRMDKIRLIYKGPIKHTERYKAYMLPSVVTDRFGNTVSYQYDGYMRLTTIQASDGRQITIQYNNEDPQHPHVITDVYANGRHWHYSYQDNSLSQVTLPDDRQWSYTLYALSFNKPQSVMDANGKNDICKAKEGDNQYSISVTHPNGVTGIFELKQQLHGRANVKRVHSQPDTAFDIDKVNKCFNAFAVTKKSLYINNQAAPYEWYYSYAGGNGYWDSQATPANLVIDPILAQGPIITSLAHCIV